MRTDGSVAVVTGANRGTGPAFAHALPARGAARVLALDRAVPRLRRVEGGAVVADQRAARTVDAITRDESEVLVDDTARRVRAALSGPLDLLGPVP
ncbi:hypothetical protein ABZ619_13975 [Streptomyces sp. NPDC007851]|uniref:hypothetical protein n=1 Tax=Streptomyces sp. NPDC007851 TaxID=3155008 RepID=UPI0033C6A7BF